MDNQSWEKREKINAHKVIARHFPNSGFPATPVLHSRAGRDVITFWLSSEHLVRATLGRLTGI